MLTPIPKNSDLPSNRGGLWSQAQVFLYRWFFTSLAGMTFGDWVKLLIENRCLISPRFWPRAAFVTAMSPANSLCAMFERRCDKRWASLDIPPPLFILGHWRSGTTYLHELLSADKRLACPTMLECLFPHSIATPSLMRPFLACFLPRTRVVDDVELGPDRPFEDEFALAILSQLSPYFAWTFPHGADRHERRLTLDNDAECARWKSALRLFAGRLFAKHKRPIVFKSPPHTARVRHILDAFPKARFVLLHRDPYEVFASTKRLILHGVDGLRLQRAVRAEVDTEILRRYRQLHERLDADRVLLANNQFLEVAYRDLERRPIETLAQLYDRLGLGDFGELRPALDKVLAGRPNYTKNVHPPLSTPLRERIAMEWKPWFDRWDYAT